jgi:hypothetical protein
MRRRGNVRTSVFHEKALLVKANVVAETLERIICPVATLPFALSKEPIPGDSVHDGVRLFGPTLQSHNRSPSERGTKTARAVAGTRDVGRAAAASYTFFVARSRSDSSR